MGAQIICAVSSILESAEFVFDWRIFVSYPPDARDNTKGSECPSLGKREVDLRENYQTYQLVDADKGFYQNTSRAWETIYRQGQIAFHAVWQTRWTGLLVTMI